MAKPRAGSEQLTCEQEGNCSKKGDSGGKIDSDDDSADDSANDQLKEDIQQKNGNKKVENISDSDDDSDDDRCNVIQQKKQKNGNTKEDDRSDDEDNGGKFILERKYWISAANRWKRRRRTKFSRTI